MESTLQNVSKRFVAQSRKSEDASDFRDQNQKSKKNKKKKKKQQRRKQTEDEDEEKNLEMSNKNHKVRENVNALQLRTDHWDVREAEPCEQHRDITEAGLEGEESLDFADPELPPELLFLGPGLLGYSNEEVDLHDQSSNILQKTTDMIDCRQSEEDMNWITPEMYEYIEMLAGRFCQDELNIVDQTIEDSLSQTKNDAGTDIRTALVDSPAEKEQINEIDLPNRSALQSLEHPADSVTETPTKLECPKVQPDVSTETTSSKKKPKQKAKPVEASRDMTDRRQQNRVNLKLKEIRLKQAQELATFTLSLKAQLVETVRCHFSYNPDRKYDVENFREIDHDVLRGFATAMNLAEEIKEEELEDYSVLKNKVVSALIRKGQIGPRKKQNILIRTFTMIERVFGSYGVVLDVEDLGDASDVLEECCQQVAEIAIGGSIKAGLKPPVIKVIVDKVVAELKRQA